MDVGRLEDVSVLIGIEVEDIRTEAMDDRHAHLADRVSGAMSMPIGAHLGLTAW